MASRPDFSSLIWAAEGHTIRSRSVKGHRWQLTEVAADEGGHLGGAAEGRRGLQVAEGAATATATTLSVHVLEVALLVQLAEALRVRRMCPGGEHQQQGDKPREAHRVRGSRSATKGVSLGLLSGDGQRRVNRSCRGLRHFSSANDAGGHLMRSIGRGAGCRRPPGSTANVHRPVINCVN